MSATMLTGLKRLSAGLATIFILSFLFFKTQALDPEKHTEIIDRLRQLKQEDAILNQNILEIRYGLLNYYDPLVHSTRRISSLLSDLDERLGALPATRERLEAVKQFWRRKRTDWNNSSRRPLC